MFTTQPSMVIYAEHRKRRPATYRDLVVKDGVNFIPLTKDKKFGRLMGFGSDVAPKVIVLATLRRLRDEVFVERVQEKLDKRINVYTARWKRGKLYATCLVLKGERHKVKMPDIGDIQGQSIEVLLGVPGSPLHVDCSNEVLTYLHRVAHQEITSSPIRAMLKRGDDGLPVGVSKTAIKFRQSSSPALRCKRPADKKQLYVKYTADDEDAYASAVKRARDFMEGVELIVAHDLDDVDDESNDCADGSDDHDGSENDDVSRDDGKANSP